jgi:hypothetical protein
MIKAALKTGLGLPMLFLGLSGENVTRLAAGEPIRISAGQMAQLGLPQVEVVIHYGRTEQDILDEIESHGIKLRDERKARKP